MKILVCFKIVPELDNVLESDWAVAGDRVDTDYVRKVYNCFDEAALELALKLKDEARSSGLEVTCTAATIGGNQAAMAKNLYAVNFDRVVVIPQDEVDFCPGKIAGIIADFVVEEGFDLVMMGKLAGVGDNGMTPLIAAEKLGWPAVTEVSRVFPLESSVNVLHSTDLGEQALSLHLPAVVVVGNTEYSYLRLATLREKLKVSQRQVEEFSCGTRTEENPSPVVQLLREKSEKHCIFLNGGTPEEKARLLFDRYLKERWST